MPKRWRIHPHRPERIAALERAAGVPAVVAQLLLCRGIDDPLAARSFLDPKLSGLRDPEELPGAAEAADRIVAAAQAKRRIVIYGDYDVDGITSISILVKCLEMIGANVGYHIPNRLSDGYGLNEEALRSLAAEGTELVVTVDCGISAVEHARTARELGLELIVTDHHNMGDELPDAAVLVHPRLPGHNYPFAGLCGAGVAFKVAWAICQRAEGAKKVSPVMREFLLQATVLAALGTVADVVPLVDENRILVRHGLIGLAKRPTPGLQALLEVAELEKQPRLTSEDIGFGLAPRLNAAGRLGQARLAVELLTTSSASRARELAQYLNELNKSRKSLERSIYLAANKQAKEQFDPERDAAFVLADRGWHPGVIGIVASRLAEKYHRPVVMLSLDDLGVKPAGGSARSVPGFDLHKALSNCKDYLQSYGGHAAAAGLKIAESEIDAFRQAFCETVAEEIRPEERVPELLIDAEAPLGAFTLKPWKRSSSWPPLAPGTAARCSAPRACIWTVRLNGWAEATAT